MATEYEKLVLEMSVNQNKFDKKMDRLTKSFNGKLGKMDRRAQVSGRAMISGLAGPLRIVTAALSIREVIRYADAWTDASNKLAASGVAMGEVANKQKELVDLAIQNRIALVGVVDLYSKTKRATADLGIEEEKLSRFVDITTKSFKAGGAAVSEQNAAILQLSQGLSSGILAGDELKSLRENAPLLAKAIADYFGTTVGGLKKLGAEGKLTADKVVKAVLEAGGTIDAQFAKTRATISDSMTNSKTAITEFIGVFDRITKTSEGASGGISNFTKTIRGMTEDLSDSGTVLGWITEKFSEFNHELQNPDETRLKEVRTELKAMKVAVEGGNNALGDFFDWFGADMMGARVDSVRRLTSELEFLENKMLKAGLGFKGRIDPEEPKFTEPKPATTTASTPKPASSFSFPKSDTAGFTTTVDSTGKDAIKAEREFLEVMKEKAAALEQEARLYGLDADQASLMRVQEEMLSEAKRLGIENTQEFSDAYTIMSAKMTDANAKIKEMQENEQLLNEVTGALEQGATDMFSAFLDGSNNDMDQAAKAMIKHLSAILIKALAVAAAIAAINAFIPGAGTASSGILQNLIGGGVDTAFGGFREKGGAVTAGKSYVVGEKRPEVFVPNTSGTIIPSIDEAAALAQQQGVARLAGNLKVSPALSSGRGAAVGGGAAGSSVNITNHYDFSGADPSVLARLPAMMQERDRKLKADIFRQLPKVQAKRARRFS